MLCSQPWEVVLYEFDITVTVLLAFAVFRLARMIACEDGPGFVFDRIREKLRISADEKRTTLAHSVYLFSSCEHCLGVWLAFLLTIFICRFTPLWWLNWLAIAGMQSAIASLTAE